MWGQLVFYQREYLLTKSEEDFLYFYEDYLYFWKIAYKMLSPEYFFFFTVSLFVFVCLEAQCYISSWISVASQT